MTPCAAVLPLPTAPFPRCNQRCRHRLCRRVGVAKYSRLRQEFQEKEDKMREVRVESDRRVVRAAVVAAADWRGLQEVDKMKRGFEEQMTKMRGEVSKIQEEKVHLMGLEQRLRQEFQTQVMRSALLRRRLSCDFSGGRCKRSRCPTRSCASGWRRCR